MRLPVYLRAEAEADLEDAAGWYERQRSGLGGEFLSEVERTLDLIQSNPEAFSAVYRGTRRSLVRRFPFGVHYRIIQDRILVFAVMHVSRDPERWKGRGA